MRFAAVNSARAGLFLVLWLYGALSASAQSCGGAYDVFGCTSEESTYQIRVPDVADPNYRIPTVVILHDAGRNGAAIIDDERLVKAFVDKGYAVLAPDALPRSNLRGHIGASKEVAELHPERAYGIRSRKRFVMTDVDGSIRYLKYKKDSGWYFYNIDVAIFGRESPIKDIKFDYLGRDEIAFLRDMLGQAAEEYGIDPKPVLVIGLGHGGSLVWQIACYAPRFGRILAPVGGAFWRKIPKNCKSGANLIHTHHRASAFWPLKGVRGREKRYARTSIYRNLDMLLFENNCGYDATTDRNDELGVNHTTWADCTESSPVEIMVLNEEFAFQTWWLDEMLGRIEKTGIKRPFEEVPELPLETGPAFKKPGLGLGSLSAEAPEDAEEPATRFKKPGSGLGSRFKRAK
jgi:poly(3-hydroxybutyrate) depolymerase